MMEQENSYEVVATKVRKEAKDRLEALCKSRGMTKYDLLQMMCDTLIRYMDDHHNLTPEMEKAMSIFEHLQGWAGKGKRVLVEGRLQTGSYEKKDGTKVYFTEVLADRVEFIDFNEVPRRRSEEAEPPEGFAQLNEDVPF